MELDHPQPVHPYRAWLDSGPTCQFSLAAAIDPHTDERVIKGRRVTYIRNYADGTQDIVYLQDQ